MAKHHMGDERSAVRALAKWTNSIATADIPAAVIEQAKLIVLDTIGCGVAGIDEDTSKAILGLVDDNASGERCSLFGRPRRAGLLDAVLANGALARVLDLNDYIGGATAKGPQIGGHPSDNVPVALAFGEAFGASGRDVLAAIVIGYEIFGRLKTLLDPHGEWDEVTASGLVAPAMAGRLMGLDDERLAHAMALGIARAPTPAIVRGGHVSAAKSIANALVAQSASQGALLAARGVTGPLAVLDAERSLRDLFARADILETLAAPLPENFYIMRASVKTYPCLATGQAAVAAALRLRELAGGDIDGLQSIEVVMADWPIVQKQQVDPDRVSPKSREAADHSFNFLVAAPLLDGEFGLRQYENERWLDPKVVALMARLKMRTEADLSARAPGAYPCRLEARTRDGRPLAAEVLFPPGFSRGGLDAASVVEKFHAVTAPHAGATARDRIVAAASALDAAASIEALMAASRLG